MQSSCFISKEHLFFCFKGDTYVGLLDDRSQNTYKGLFLWKVTTTGQILCIITIFIKIAEFEKDEKEQNS